MNRIELSAKQSTAGGGRFQVRQIFDFQDRQAAVRGGRLSARCGQPTCRNAFSKAGLQNGSMTLGNMAVISSS